VNSRVWLSFCRKPTKVWWQTFVTAGRFHHIVAIPDDGLAIRDGGASAAQKTIKCRGADQVR